MQLLSYLSLQIGLVLGPTPYRSALYQSLQTRMRFEDIACHFSDIDWTHIRTDIVQDRRVQLAIATAGVASIFLFRRLIKKRFNLPPGPTPWPIVGNLLGEYETQIVYCHWCVCQDRQSYSGLSISIFTAEKQHSYPNQCRVTDETESRHSNPVCESAGLWTQVIGPTKFRLHW